MSSRVSGQCLYTKHQLAMGTFCCNLYQLTMLIYKQTILLSYHDLVRLYIPRLRILVA